MSVLSDPKLKYASPTENELRTTYPFANLYFSFPTKPFALNDIYFPAYMKKVSDTITPTYTQTQIFGRSDPIATYKNTTRKISVEFDIPAYSEYDANQILIKFGTLMKNLYPGYMRVESGQLIINSPPLIRLKFANVICNPFNTNLGLLGFPDAVVFNHVYSENGIFVVPSENKQDGFVFAKSYTLSMNFTALHEEVIGWDDSNGASLAPSFYPEINPAKIPTSAKVGTATSNLRGTVTQDPATAKGLTMIFGV